VNIEITRAKNENKQAIIDLSHHFTEDYLDLVLDRWISQEKGGLYLAWDNHTLVGCCALYFPSPTEGWLQGMRIRPDCQGQGIAYHLNANLIKLAAQEGAQVVRLITSPHNYQALRLAEKLGFKVTGDHREIVFRQPLNTGIKDDSSEKLPSPLLCNKEEKQEALKILSAGPAAHSGKGMLFGPRFTFRKLTPSYLEQAIDENEVYLFFADGKTSGVLVTIKQESESHLVCGYLNAPNHLLPSLFKLLPDWQVQGFQYFTFNMLQDQHLALQPGLKKYFGQYNYEKMLLMEKPLNAD